VVDYQSVICCIHCRLPVLISFPVSISVFESKFFSNNLDLAADFAAPPFLAVLEFFLSIESWILLKQELLFFSEVELLVNEKMNDFQSILSRMF
jgi:hypothetical protein